MNFKGVIIEESLKDTSLLKNIDITKTEYEIVTSKHKTPWINMWTMYTVGIPESQAEKTAKQISTALDRKHNWYADFKNDKFHYIIFRNKIFKVDLKNPVLYKDAKAYGIILGIPAYQLDFTPEKQ